MWRQIRLAPWQKWYEVCGFYSSACVSELAALTKEERQDLHERQVYDDDFTLRLLHAASELCG